MKTKQYQPLIILALIWAVYYIATKVAVARLSVFLVGVCIRLLAFIGLSLIMWRKGELPLLLKIRGILLRLIGIGILGFSLDFTAFMGLKLSSASNGVILLKSDILFANLITIWIIKERFTKLDWLYSMIMLLGVFLIMDVDVLKLKFNGIGDLFFILSAFLVTLNAFIIKSVQLDRANSAEDNVIAFYNNLICLLFFVMALLITGEFGTIGTLKSDPRLVGVLLTAGLAQTLIYICYYFNLRRLPVWMVKIFLLLMPIFAVIISHFVLNEVLSMKKVIGMLVVLGGAAGIICTRHNKEDRSYSHGI